MLQPDGGFDVSPLFLHPFATFDSVVAPMLVNKLHKHCRNEKLGVVAISEQRDNTVFQICLTSAANVSDASKAFTSTSVRDAKAKILILMYPHCVCVSDKDANIITKQPTPGASVSVGNRLTFKPIMWSLLYQRLVAARHSMRPLMAETQKAAADGKLVDCLKKSLSDEMEAREDHLQQLTDCKKRQTSLKTSMSSLQKDRALVSKKIVNVHLKAQRCKADMSTLRREVHGLLDAFKQSLDDWDLTAISKVVRVAAQCSHYFKYDRYSSAHMRRLLIVKDEKQGIKLSSLSQFPLIQQICDGDHVILRAGLATLRGVMVDGDTVWF